MGVAIVLAAVFIPTAFVPGITGRLYQQFAVTIAVSVVISAFNALSLSPALAALLLRPKEQGRGPLARFFAWFNRVFGRATDGYVNTCSVLIHKFGFSLVLLLGLGSWPSWLARRFPQGSCPMKTRVTSLSICSFLMPRRCSVPARLQPRLRTS